MQNPLLNELRSFCKQWGITQRPQSVTEVLHAYLCCSLAIPEWTDVYVEVFGSADRLLLDARRAAFPGESVASTFNKRRRQASLYAHIFAGTVLPQDLHENPTYVAFKESVARAMHPFGVSDFNTVAVMHLIGDVRDLQTVLEDEALGFNVKLVGNLHVNVALVVWKFDTRDHKTFVRDMAAIITGCRYDGCLQGLTVDDVFQQQEQTTVRGTRRTTTRDVRQDSNTITTRQRVTNFKTSMHRDSFPRHARLEWDTEFERGIADDPRFSTLKKALGKPAFCNNKTLVNEYLLYATVCTAATPCRDDYVATADVDLQKLLLRFVDRMDATTLCDLDDVKEFETIMIQYGNPAMQRNWTTRELLLHLFMAYHPKWKQYYSALWNHDISLVNAVEQYLTKYPNISPVIVIGMFP